MSAFPHVSEALGRSIADIEPRSFNEHLHAVLDDRPLTPAALTVTTGRAIDSTADREQLAELGIGVQLGYEGLRLTRELINEDSWLDDQEATDSDIDVLAAEVLVARGFNILAETGTVTQAVDIVRRFGRNSARARAGSKQLDPSLEADIISLAVTTGADCVLSTVPPAIDSLGEELGARFDEDPMPEPAVALDGVKQEIAKVYTLHEPSVVEERSPSSTVDP